MSEIGIVALAPKLMVELWRFLEIGVLPAGAELKTDVRLRRSGKAIDSRPHETASLLQAARWSRRVSTRHPPLEGAARPRQATRILTTIPTRDATM